MIGFGPSCRMNPIRAIDAREESFDVLRIAEYLGWEEGKGDSIASSKNCPRLKLTVMRDIIHDRRGVLAVAEEKSETSYGPTAVLMKPERTRFLYFFVETEDGQEQEVRIVTVTNPSGSQIIIRKESGPQKQDAPVYNFLAVIRDNTQ